MISLGVTSGSYASSSYSSGNYNSSRNAAAAVELRPAELNSARRSVLSDSFPNDDSIDRPVASLNESDATGNTNLNSGRSVTDEASAQNQDDKESAEVRREAQQLKLEQEQIKQLAARDREVRAHEQAHAAVGGQYAGAPTYEFQRGPDGVRYAVGGEVPIDISKAATPQETIQKMQVVRRAALAPAEPSPQDRRVASQASTIETQARQELAVENRQRNEGSSQSNTNGEQVENTTATAGEPSAVAIAPPSIERAPVFTPFRSALPPNDVISVLKRTILASDESRQLGRLFDQSV